METTSTQKIWTSEEIRHNLENNDHWLFRGVLAIYRYQTQDEQRDQFTKHLNNVGFTVADSKFLSSIATWLLNGRSLSIKQVRKTRFKMLKYSGQLARIANKNQ